MRDVLESVLTSLRDGDTDYASALLTDALNQDVEEEALKIIGSAFIAVKEGKTEEATDLLQSAIGTISPSNGNGTGSSDVIVEAEWSAEEINNLPDSCFAFVEPGGKKDKDGKTTPRSLRHLPYKDAKGKVDMPHLLAALSRANQIKLKDGSKISSVKATQIRNHLRGMMSQGKTHEAGACEDGTCPYEHVDESAPVDVDEGVTFVSEAMGIIEEAFPSEPNVYLATIIQSGRSKNRYYWRPDTLERNTRMFEGVRAFADHPTKTEMAERPERSVRDIVGWYEGVYWVPNGMGGGSLKGKMHLLEGPVADIVREAHTRGKPDLVQLSVNVSARHSPKYIDGVLVREISELVRVHSVDAITEASAGGSIDRVVGSGSGSST